MSEAELTFQQQRSQQREIRLQEFEDLHENDDPLPINQPHTAPVLPSKRSLGQQRRRQREREERLNIEEHPQPHTIPLPQSNQSLGQQQRRQREREERINIEEYPQRVLRRENTLQLINNTSIPWFSAARQPYIEPQSRFSLGRMDLECPFCKALHWKGELLSSATVTRPAFGICCNSGQVHLPLLKPLPPLLNDLFLGQHQQAREFQDNIWKYNRAFSFTSICANEDHSINVGRGAPVFRIMGEYYQRIGPLEPNNSQSPSYAQLYIYNPHEALETRIQSNTELNPNTIRIIQDTLIQYHQYAPIFKHVHELLTSHSDHVSIRLRHSPSLDHRRYNAPTVDEVAVIICDGNGEAPSPSRDIVLNLRSGGLKIVSDLHPAYLPLAYPLLFPYGDNGWHPDLRLYQMTSHNTIQQTDRRLTQSRYIAYRIQVRKDEFSSILHSRRLLQRFLVDAYATIDQNRLFFLRHNQPRLRACLYSGLEDALTAESEDVDLNMLGFKIILPSSYIGGPRHMQQRYQDSMAIARHFRHVDLFITVTANPGWAEITAELNPGETPNDRPELVARVFQLKKKAIIDYIWKEGIFGRSIAYIYTVEFQKRGLPHFHLLVFLDEPFRLNSPESINSIIRASWPDPVREPLLFETVKRCMVHGPCGTFNPKAPCMDNSRCTKGYPKPFSDFTTMDHSGFPIYERKDDNRGCYIGDFWVDNRWIVPYNPFLSALFDCHINVEMVVSGGSLKYLFKYIQKGGDMASIDIQNDEILQHLTGRYISASEAVHRILHFDMHDQVPNVVRLQVHLPGQHMVLFNPDDNPQLTLQRASMESTTLTAYFKSNADNGLLGIEARKYTYAEFPQHFTWKDKEKMWNMRKQGYAIGRMYFVSPTAGERFYLRTLLTVVKGATSFEDLQTHNGVKFNTFRESCLSRGLLQDDGEWRTCLEEAGVMQTGHQLRRLFVTILIFCAPAKPEDLWSSFRHLLCDDLSHRVTTLLGPQAMNDETIYDYGLFLLDTLLLREGKSLAKNWPSMPQLLINWNSRRINPLIMEQLNYDIQHEYREWERKFALLNQEQRNTYNEIMSSITDGKGDMIFVNGPGGTGKTFLYHVICNKVRSEGLIVLCVASSGIASLLLPGGRTAHSTFQIPIDITDQSMCSVDKSSQRAELFRNTKVIIWDEAGTQHRHAIEAVDRTLQDICGSHLPFGGITMILGGDFQQTLPIIPNGSREEIVEATILKSKLWEKVKIYHLCENMRIRNDSHIYHFSRWLLDIGHGRNIDQEGKVNIPMNMRKPSYNALLNFIYSDINQNPPPPPIYFSDRMILAPRNVDVSDTNQELLDRMAGDATIYYSVDEVVRDEHSPNAPPIPIEYLRSLNLNTLPPGELHLKIGCPIILIRNLSSTQGLCNGTRLVVTRMSSRIIEGKIIGGDHNGELALIPRISLIPQERFAETPFRIKRRQFPIRLAFSLTINRSQGQSVNKVGLDLRVPVFGHGQLYVALSRATASEKIGILTPNNGTDITVANVVYPEVLID